MGEARIQREFPVCEGKGESRVLRSRTNLAHHQLRIPPVKAWKSMLQTFAVAHSQLAEWANQPFEPFTHFCTISTDYLKRPPETPVRGILHSHASVAIARAWAAIF